MRTGSPRGSAPPSPRSVHTAGVSCLASGGSLGLCCPWRTVPGLCLLQGARWPASEAKWLGAGSPCALLQPQTKINT